MILLLGGTGYVACAFKTAFKKRNINYCCISRSDVEYYKFNVFYNFLTDLNPELVINAAGYTGKPNVDACELYKAETIVGNIILPQTLSNACEMAGVPFAHISSGCIYSGAIHSYTNSIINLQDKEYRLSEIEGFTEDIIPNFTFSSPPCSFYSGTKAIAEDIVRLNPHHYLWRLRIPFNHHNNHRNYLSKIQNYEKVYDNYNSLSHLDDFTNACIDLWINRAPFGTYNVTNPGYISTREVVDLIKKYLKTNKEFKFWENDEEFYKFAKTPRSNCILDSSKLWNAAGVKMRNVEDALEHSLRNWAY